MSNRSNLPPYKVLSQGDLSQATVTTTPTDVRNQDNVMYQFNVTGAAAAGTIDIQVSNDYVPPTTPGGTPQNAGTWTSLGSAYQATVAGAGTGVIMLTQIEAPFTRALFTKTSGSGNMDAYVSGKRL